MFFCFFFSFVFSVLVNVQSSTRRCRKVEPVDRLDCYISLLNCLNYTIIYSFKYSPCGFYCSTIPHAMENRTIDMCVSVYIQLITFATSLKHNINTFFFFLNTTQCNIVDKYFVKSGRSKRIKSKLKVDIASRGFFAQDVIWSCTFFLYQ